MSTDPWAHYWSNDAMHSMRSLSNHYSNEQYNLFMYYYSFLGSKENCPPPLYVFSGVNLGRTISLQLLIETFAETVPAEPTEWNIIGENLNKYKLKALGMLDEVYVDAAILLFQYEASIRNTFVHNALSRILPDLEAREATLREISDPLHPLNQAFQLDDLDAIFVQGLTIQDFLEFGHTEELTEFAAYMNQDWWDVDAAAELYCQLLDDPSFQTRESSRLVGWTIMQTHMPLVLSLTKRLVLFLNKFQKLPIVVEINNTFLFAYHPAGALIRANEFGVDPISCQIATVRVWAHAVFHKLNPHASVFESVEAAYIHKMHKYYITAIPPRDTFRLLPVTNHPQPQPFQTPRPLRGLFDVQQVIDLIRATKEETMSGATTELGKDKSGLLARNWYEHRIFPLFPLRTLRGKFLLDVQAEKEEDIQKVGDSLQVVDYLEVTINPLRRGLAGVVVEPTKIKLDVPTPTDYPSYLRETTKLMVWYDSLYWCKVSNRFVSQINEEGVLRKPSFKQIMDMYPEEVFSFQLGTCSVCLEETSTATKGRCGRPHYLCIPCFERIRHEREKDRKHALCPECRCSISGVRIVSA